MCDSFKGIIYNEDSDNFLYRLVQSHKVQEADRDMLCAYVDQMKDSGITDFFFCVSGLYSAIPTKVLTFAADRAGIKEERGKAVDFTDTPAGAMDYIWNQKGLDLYQIWFDRCREHGIKPWASFRMNDCHCLFEDPTWLVPEDVWSHFSDRSRIRHREQTGYYDRCRDYELPQVRERFLAYLTETLERYDVEGIELDFQRDIFCFAPGHEEKGRAILTALVGKVRGILDNAEKKYGHRIRLAARALTNPHHCYDGGFDVVEWAKRGYIDMYIAAPYFACADADIPIALWKQLLDPYHIELAGGIEVPLFRINGTSRVCNSTDTALGIANSILSDGADKVYLFNYYPLLFGDPCPDNDNCPTSKAGSRRLFTVAGDRDRLLHEKRKNLITYVDRVPLGYKSEPQFPQTVANPDYPLFLRIKTGNILPQSEVILEIGVPGDMSEQDITVYVNSTPTVFKEIKTQVEPAITDAPVFCFTVPTAALSETVQIVEILNTDRKRPLTVDSVAMEINI